MMAPLAVAKLAWTVIGVSAAALSLPGTFELLLVTLGNLVPRRAKTPRSAGSALRVAVVVPAHNEEASVASTVTNLLRARHRFAEVAVVVVADNCTDATASRAHDAGARVLVRSDAGRMGKGYALDYAFQVLVAEQYGALLVVDADTEAAANFVEEAGSALEAGADAVQARYLVRNPETSPRTRLLKIALLAFNVARPRGRDHLGFSCGLLGNGFGVRRETLLAVPYSAASVVEDLEYHLMLVKSGRKVRFLNQTGVFGDMPESGKGVRTQRTRWEGGRFRMLREHAGPLAAAVTRGHFTSLEPLLELSLLPLAFHATLLLFACATLRGFAGVVGLAGVLVVLVHLLEALLLGGSLKDGAALLLAPFYVVWKILLIPALVKSSRRHTAWTRTERTIERPVP